jgi:hypothetical protein
MDGQTDAGFVAKNQNDGNVRDFLTGGGSGLLSVTETLNTASAKPIRASARPHGISCSNRISFAAPNHECGFVANVHAPGQTSFTQENKVG